MDGLLGHVHIAMYLLPNFGISGVRKVNRPEVVVAVYMVLYLYTLQSLRCRGLQALKLGLALYLLSLPAVLRPELMTPDKS